MWGSLLLQNGLAVTDPKLCANCYNEKQLLMSLTPQAAQVAFASPCQPLELPDSFISGIGHLHWATTLSPACEDWTGSRAACLYSTLTTSTQTWQEAVWVHANDYVTIGRHAVAYVRGCYLL